MFINKSMISILALLVGLMLVVIIVLMYRTFNKPPNLTEVERTSTLRTATFQNAGFTPENSFPSPSRILSVTSTPLMTSTPLVTSTVSKTILTTKALHVALRAGPHINHPEVSKNYDNGTPMEILGTHDSWYFAIAPDGAKGWLYEEWLNVDSSDITDIPIITIVPTVPVTPTNRPRQPQEQPQEQPTEQPQEQPTEQPRPPQPTEVGPSPYP